MRVSTAFYYQNSTLALTARQDGVNQVLQQISTNRRIVTPSDDAIGAANALNASQAIALSDNYLNNMATASNKLSEENTVLGGISKLLGQAKNFAETVGGNPTSTQRSDFAVYLTSVRDALTAYANQTDSEGNYLFSGAKGNTIPYTFTSVADNTTVPATTTVTTTYNGDTNQQSIAISKGRNLPVSDSGQAVFGTVPNDVFTTINQLIKDLSSTTSLTGSAFNTAMNTAVKNIETAATTVQDTNVQVANRMQEIDVAKSTETLFKTQSQSELSRLEDVDMQQAAVQLKLQQTSLEALQQSFVSSSKLSLFNFI